MSRMCISKQANKVGTIFALIADGEDKYSVFKLCENYDGKCKGGIRKTWRVVQSKMEKSVAESLFQRRLAGTQK